MTNLSRLPITYMEVPVTNINICIQLCTYFLYFCLMND